MAFKAANYVPQTASLAKSTLDWLMESQRDDGGFGPWKNHPAASDVFCTSISTLGMVQYKESVPARFFQKSFRWLMGNRLANGIWPFHEIEDGASWGLYTLTMLTRYGLSGNV